MTFLEDSKADFTRNQCDKYFCNGALQLGFIQLSIAGGKWELMAKSRS